MVGLCGSGASSEMQRNRYAVAFGANVDRNAYFPIAAHVKTHAFDFEIATFEGRSDLRHCRKPVIVLGHAASHGDVCVCDRVAVTVFDMQDPGVNPVDHERLQLALETHPEMTRVRCPGLIVRCIYVRCEEGTGQQQRCHARRLARATTHEPVTQLQRE